MPEAQLTVAVSHAIAPHDGAGDGRLAFPQFREFVMASVAAPQQLGGGGGLAVA